MVTCGFDPHLSHQVRGNYMSLSKEIYLQEYAKYRHIKLFLDETYTKRSRPSEKVILINISEENESAKVKNLRTGNVQTKTLHWCRKNLIKE